jgi:stalled ribosome alternative rescue factor ArfA
MKSVEIYKKYRKPLLDRGVVVTRVEPSKKGRGSYNRKNKYGKRIEYDECG